MQKTTMKSVSTIDDSKFMRIVPSLSHQEEANLKEEIKRDGIRDPLVIWGNVLLDGHHRLKISKELKLDEVPIIEMTFENDNIAKLWMVKNQNSRRNLNAAKKLNLAYGLEDWLSEIARKRQGRDKTSDKYFQIVTNFTGFDIDRIDVLDIIAKIAGVSKDTARKFNVIKKNAKFEEKEQLWRDEISINTIYKKYKHLVEKKNTKSTSILPKTLPSGVTNYRDKYPSEIITTQNDETIKLNKIYNEDCLQTLSRMQNNFLDLIVTSPPYNINLGNDSYNGQPYDLYEDDRNYEDYLSWLKEIFTKCYRVLKNDGRICINIADSANGARPTHSDLIQLLIKIGYKSFSTIIWDKNQIRNRTSWGSFKNPACPSFPTPFEYILIFAKESKKLLSKGVTDISREEFIEWSMALWNFLPETRQNEIGHPAMFPVELPTRCIKMLSWMDAIVYDPFLGAGTTSLACVRTGRNFIGSEISKNYCEISERRIIEEFKMAVSS